MDLQKRLNDMGFLCPKPIASKNGNLINSHSRKNYTIVSFLNGKWSLDVGLSEIEQGAKALAEFHNLTEKINKEGLSRDNSLGKKFWIDTYAKIRTQAEEKFTGLKEAANQGFSEMEKIPDNLPKAIIHADFFPDNVLFENKNVSGVIDFYMACTDNTAYDLAIMLNSWCFEKDFSFNKKKAEKLLNTYNSIRKLQQNELESFRLLGIAGSIRFMCSRLHDYFIRDESAIVNVKDPVEYIEKLKFHLSVRSYKEYGL
jgi:homoserine kinase type II